MKHTNFFKILMAGIFVTFLAACSDEEPPTADINASIDGYTATFSAGATNTTAYLWNFGDNNTSAEANPVHTYSMSGTFTVSLKVTGTGGEMTDTETIQILPSVECLLAGSGRIGDHSNLFLPYDLCPETLIAGGIKNPGKNFPVEKVG